MDSSRQALENADLEKLNDKDKQELRQFLANESQRSQIQSRKLLSPRCRQYPCDRTNNRYCRLVPCTSADRFIFCRNPRPDRSVLEKMRDRCHSKLEAGEWGGEVLG